MIRKLAAIALLSSLSTSRPQQAQSADAPKPQGARHGHRAMSCASAIWWTMRAPTRASRCSARRTSARPAPSRSPPSSTRCGRMRSKVVDTNSLSEVIVTRLSRTISKSDIEERIARAVAGQYGYGEAATSPSTIDRDVRTMHVEQQVSWDLSVARLQLDPRSGRFDIWFELSGSNVARRLPLRFTGHIMEMVEAVALTRTIGRNEIIRPADVSIERRPKAEVAGDIVDARTGDRLLHPPRAARRHDAAPRRHHQARRGEPQRSRHHQLPGARHLTDAARQGLRSRAASATSINVLNIQSNRTVAGHRRRPGPRHHRLRHGTRRAASFGRRRSRPASPMPAPSSRKRIPCNQAERPSEPNKSKRRNVSVMNKLSRLSSLASITVCASMLGGCAALERLGAIGEKPALSSIDKGPTTQPGYKPVQMPMPVPQPRVLQPELAVAERLARLLQGSARASGRRHPDHHGQPERQGGPQRQRRPRSRTSAEDSASIAFFGKSKVPISRTSAVPTQNLQGRLQRFERRRRARSTATKQLTTNVAAVITQVLPNGNLVIEGKQEIRINLEVRELDRRAASCGRKTSRATTPSTPPRSREARIAYGGRGQITDVQQPRYGQQVLDVLLPF